MSGRPAAWLVLMLAAVPATGRAQHVEHGGVASGPWHLATMPADSASAAELVAVIESQLALGDPQGADALLRRLGDRLDPADRLAAAAGIAAAEGKWTAAARAYTAAAQLGGGRARGLHEARAGAAYEAAGLPDSAGQAYRRARILLEDVQAWLAVREALVALDSTVIDSLLAVAPSAAGPLVLEAWSRLRLLQGRPVDAEALLDAAGRAGRAADLALARGDTLQAIRYAERAVVSDDSAEIRYGFAFFLEQVEPRTAAAALAAASGAARMRSSRQAAAWGERAVVLGDSSAATLLRVGTWLEAAGRRRDALSYYAAAGVDGIVPHARTRLRLGDRSAVAALRDFADTQPEHPQAATALYLAAAASNSDAQFLDVATRWPGSSSASQARMRLILDRLERRDSAGAELLLDDEIAIRGRSALQARYLRARVKASRRDVAAAAAEFSALAVADSFGYYGVIARAAAGLGPPTVARDAPTAPDATAAAMLRQLAILDSLGFDREAGLLVRSLVTREWETTSAMLDAAEGLVRLGRANQAIRLGYRAAQELSLNHPRVLRAVFPWPDRALVEREAAATGLDPFLVAGLIRQESWFFPLAISRAGAVGYMQLMPATARDVARRLRVPWSDAFLTVGDANVHLGTAHLAGLFRRYPGDTVAALAAYNAGGTPTDRWRRRAGAVDPPTFVERIGYPETQDYVRAVVRNRAVYRWLYGPPEAR